MVIAKRRVAALVIAALVAAAGAIGVSATVDVLSAHAIVNTGDTNNGGDF